MNDILLVFDLDGTLIDTSYDIIESLNYSLKSIDVEPVHYEQIAFLVGQGARAALSRALELRKRDTSEAELDVLVNRLVSHYEQDMPGKSRAYDGLLDALVRLQAEGVRFAICTNKLEHLATLLIKKMKMAQYFEVLTGGDSYTFRKPDGQHIIETVKLAKGNLDRTVMIGDSINDIAAAKDAGIPSIGVPFGFSDVPIEELQPDVVINHYDELTTQLIIDLLDK